MKTRLAASLGEVKALEIYQHLLRHTRTVMLHLEADIFVFLTRMPEDDFWSGFRQELQIEGDLGQKMESAFAQVFALGYQEVFILGSDCPGLTESIVHQGFALFQQADVVIGPAADGGYYALGIKKLHTEMFRNKVWSTATVCQEARETAASLQLSVALLPVLTDVDTEADVPAEWL